MQVILMEKVTNLGNLGDIVKVKDGYARNYLIPQKKAKRATPENIAEFERRRAELERQQAEKLAAAQALASRLEGITVQITRKAGEDGRLFGSVTNIDIAEGLQRQIGFARLGDTGQLVLQHGAGIDQQAANQRALAVIDGAAGDKAQRVAVISIKLACSA